MAIVNVQVNDEHPNLSAPKEPSDSELLVSVFDKYQKAYLKLHTESMKAEALKNSLQLTIADLERGLGLIFAGKLANLSKQSKTLQVMAAAGCPDSTEAKVEQEGNAVKPRKVKFADDYGQKLTIIHLVEINSSQEKQKQPDPWPRKLLIPSAWRPRFNQPCRNRAQIEKNLQQHHVTLESVVIRNDVHRLSGSIKARNLPDNVDKIVLVRYSVDRWRSAKDQLATHCGTDSVDYYDMYDFDFLVPCGSDAFPILEFKVGLKVCGIEFWDNNNGKMYSLVSEHSKEHRKCSRQSKSDEQFWDPKKHPALVLV